MGKCRHDNLRGIYGDEINATNGMRSECVDCRALFPALPRAEFDALVRQRDEAERVAASAMVDRANALARAERAEEALRFYAEEYNYHPWDGRDGAKDGIPALEDRGAKAREALGKAKS